VALCLTALRADAKGADKKKPIEVSGTWSTDLMGAPDLTLAQRGALVWGRDGDGSLLHGSWVDGRLILFYRPGFTGQAGATCNPMVKAVLEAASNTKLAGFEFIDTGESPPRSFTRASTVTARSSAHPAALELRACGALLTNDLVFRGDKLASSDSPMLQAVAQLLKDDSAARIRIQVHTDSSGKASQEKTRTQHRADAIKSALVSRYGADAARVVAIGLGGEQPLAPNKTESGKALNRRVEFFTR
jgi:hypothetical protein